MERPPSPSWSSRSLISSAKFLFSLLTVSNCSTVSSQAARRRNSSELCHRRETFARTCSSMQILPSYFWPQQTELPRPHSQSPTISLYWKGKEEGAIPIKGRNVRAKAICVVLPWLLHSFCEDSNSLERSSHFIFHSPTTYKRGENAICTQTMRLRVKDFPVTRFH